MSPSQTVIVDERFCGPPDSGNGGYVCGQLAAHLSGVAVVRLHRPPPLGRALEVHPSETGVELLDGDGVVASAQPSSWDDAFRVPAAPHYDEAEKAAQGFSGYELHWFPGCFVCGPRRAEGDGLRIFPGAVAGSDLVAGPWHPDASLADADGRVRDEFMWAALDCAGAFAFPPDPERALVLGSLTALIAAPPSAGDRCIVVGWPAGIDGRKYFAGTAIFSESGERLAVARATWIRIEPPNRGSP